jgi:hypothetical protein
MRHVPAADVAVVELDLAPSTVDRRSGRAVVAVKWSEAGQVLAEQRRVAERLDAPTALAGAAADAGLVALQAGRYAEAAGLLAEALAGLRSGRPACALARAEALAQDGRLAAASA